MKLAEYHADFMRAVRFDKAPDALVSQVRGAGGLTPTDAVEVYRNMYWFRLVDACFDLLPRTACALGKKRFTEETCRFLAESPSRFPALERLARPLATFLAARDLPEIVKELAGLEASFVDSLLAPDSEHAPFGVEHTASPVFGALRLSPHPSLVCATASEGAIALYGEDAEAEVEPRHGLPECGRSHELVFARPRHSVAFHELEPGEREIFECSEIRAADAILLLAGESGDATRAYARLRVFIHTGLFVVLEP